MTIFAPYRTESSIDKYVPKKYGLIKKSGPNPWKFFSDFGGFIVDASYGKIKEFWNKHRCDYPGRLTRFWHAVKGSPFDNGSYYRCLCGKIWEYSIYWDRWDHWHHDDALEQWIKHGGEV